MFCLKLWVEMYWPDEKTISNIWFVSFRIIDYYISLIYGCNDILGHLSSPVLEVIKYVIIILNNG